MSCPEDKKIAGDIHACCQALRILAVDRALNLLTQYTKELIRWNQRINLTGAKTTSEFVQGPLFDALTLIPVLITSGELADLGSGGGLPGIPAAVLAPQCRVILVEPRAKRAHFLNHMCFALGLSVEIIEARAETLAPRRFGGAVAQAVWPPVTWLAKAPSWVQLSGAVYALTSEPLSSTDIPPHLKLEEQYATHRPLDSAPRFSYRLRLKSLEH